MKLSDKGYEKLNKHACTLIDPVWVAELWKDGACEEELEQDDFVGGVVLTVEEATEILDFLSYLDMRGYRDSFLDGLADCCKNLKDRIEKA